MVLIICQFGKLLHRAVGLVTFEDNGVEHLSHDEEVIDLVLQYLLKRFVSVDIKLVCLGVFDSLVALLPLGSRLEELEFLIHLVLELFQLIEEEFLVPLPWLALVEIASRHEALLVFIPLKVNLLFIRGNFRSS